MGRCGECHANSCYYSASCFCDCHNESTETSAGFPIRREGSVVYVGERKPLDPNFKIVGVKMENDKDLKESLSFDIKLLYQSGENNVSVVEYDKLWRVSLNIYVNEKQLQEIQKRDLKVTITPGKTEKELLREEKLNLLKEIDAVTPLTPELALKVIEEFDLKHK